MTSSILPLAVTVLGCFSLRATDAFATSSCVAFRNGVKRNAMQSFDRGPSNRHHDDKSLLLGMADQQNPSDDEFSPAFDGQLFFGIPSDKDGNLQTTLSELEQKTGIKEPPTTALVPDPDHRERSTLRRTPIISRTIPIPLPHDPNFSVTIWEMENPSDLVQVWMTGSFQQKERIGDPFGVVMWPGSILASKELAKFRQDVFGKTVLVLGAGLGVEAQTAAKLGAEKVIAVDINPFTLRLLRYGAERGGLSDIIETREIDILVSEEELPDCDVMVIADVLYNEVLAKGVGERCLEALGRKPRPRLIVTDSQRFHGTDFLGMLNEEGGEVFAWEEVVLKNVTGSGILIEEDQTYDSKVRMLSVGRDL